MIRLQLNRHVIVVLDDGSEIDLRPPNVDEWKQILHAYGTADEEINQRLGVGQNESRSLWGGGGDDEPAPYSEAFALLVNLLSSGATADVEAGRLPMWVGRGSLFAKLYAHWRECEVVVEGGVSAVPWTTPPPGAMPEIDLEALGSIDPEASPSDQTAPVGGISASRQAV